MIFLSGPSPNIEIFIFVNCLCFFINLEIYLINSKWPLPLTNLEITQIFISLKFSDPLKDYMKLIENGIIIIRKII